MVVLERSEYLLRTMSTVLAVLQSALLLIEMIGAIWSYVIELQDLSKRINILSALILDLIVWAARGFVIYQVARIFFSYDEHLTIDFADFVTNKSRLRYGLAITFFLQM